MYVSSFLLFLSLLLWSLLSVFAVVVGVGVVGVGLQYVRITLMFLSNDYFSLCLFDQLTGSGLLLGLWKLIVFIVGDHCVAHSMITAIDNIRVCHWIS